ncbi:hypothetical protein BDV95DRAFT_218655 [Massariosphaeria phaeospora]|uniref:Uncharacterized protein n=1 Tax=Massariosphaeria phaeospora TaxID=100035 RepID=A0A7C8ICG4_9PLEO|nr:hypothetical protein BDV95DRAFT_218655 [Massariosphaeria phaeospora]
MVLRSLAPAVNRQHTSSFTVHDTAEFASELAARSSPRRRLRQQGPICLTEYAFQWLMGPLWASDLRSRLKFEANRFSQLLADIFVVKANLPSQAKTRASPPRHPHRTSLDCPHLPSYPHLSTSSFSLGGAASGTDGIVSCPLRYFRKYAPDYCP